MNTIKVLLADDHELFRRSLAEFLMNYGGVEIVAQTGSGSEAICLAGEHEPEVVLLDLNMPGRNGFEATKAIKVRRPQTKIFVISANEGDIYRKMAELNGADDYIDKFSVKNWVVEFFGRLAKARQLAA